MRISTANGYQSSIESLMDRQTRMTSTQQQMTTGKRVNVASDDPAAAARAERGLAAQARTVAEQRAVDASNTAITLGESALGNAGDLLQSVRETMVQAGNQSLSDADRKSLAAQLTQYRGQLLAVANGTDGNGSYLFGGQGANQPPFIDAPGGVQFRGATGQTAVASSDALPMTLDGQTAWMRAPTGNGVFATSAPVDNGHAWINTGSVTDASALTGSTYQIQFSVAAGATTYSVLKDGVATAQTGVAYTSGQAISIDGTSTTITGAPADGDAFQIAPSTPTQTVFDTIDKAIADLNTPGRNGGQIAQANSVNLQAVDAVMGQLQAARSSAGAVLNRADADSSRLADNKLASQTEVSNATDLDMTQAISDFTNQQTGYDAALKAYSMVQGLSLFKYLSA